MRDKGRGSFGRAGDDRPHKRRRTDDSGGGVAYEGGDAVDHKAANDDNGGDVNARTQGGHGFSRGSSRPFVPRGRGIGGKTWRQLDKKKSKWIIELERQHGEHSTGGGADGDAETHRRDHHQAGRPPEGTEHRERRKGPISLVDAAAVDGLAQRKRKRGGKKERERQEKMNMLARGGGSDDPVSRGSHMEEEHPMDDDVDEDQDRDAEKSANDHMDDENDEKGGDDEELADDEVNFEDEADSPLDEKQNPTVIPQAPQAKQEKPSKLAGLPQWLANPITIPANLTLRTEESATTNPSWGLSPRIISALQKQNITHLFPVQQAVLPRLLTSRHSTSPNPSLGDICVSAPTGSGKTLAYGLPILEALSCRVVVRLRALIVLPTRDLAVQVKASLDTVCKGSGLKIALVTGASSFREEQNILVDLSHTSSTSRDWATDLSFNGTTPANDVYDDLTDDVHSDKVDILIATPGRLVDHIRGTPGFSLRHLRFLVVDEADRLLNQSYQGWLDLVLDAAMGVYDSRREKQEISTDAAPRVECASGSKTVFEAVGIKLDALGAPVHDAVTLRSIHRVMDTVQDDGIFVRDRRTVSETSEVTSATNLRHYTPLQKLLFSATLTRNPAKIASLRLFNPTYIAVSGPLTDGTAGGDESKDKADGVSGGERYIVPATLLEQMVVVNTPRDKPLALLHLLFNLRDPDQPEDQKCRSGVLIFTKSIAAAHRLATLINIFDSRRHGKMHRGNEANNVAEAITSDLTGQSRRRILASFQATGASATPVNSTLILVATDLMARGIDLGESCRIVISYDVPPRPKTYVHRVGRTARAGRAGSAVSLVEKMQATWFRKKVIGKVGRAPGVGVRRVRVDGVIGVPGFVDDYTHSLQALGEVVKGVSGPGASGVDIIGGDDHEEEEEIESEGGDDDDDDLEGGDVHDDDDDDDVDDEEDADVVANASADNSDDLVSGSRQGEEVAFTKKNAGKGMKRLTPAKLWW